MPTLLPPLTGYPITQEYGWTAFARENPGLYGPGGHPGIDYGVPEGTGVHASAPGTVTHAGPMGGLGIAVEIDHGGGVKTRYGHLSAALVAPGDRVEAGQLIGRSGNSGASTGPHLHWEVLSGGVQVDPLGWIGRAVEGIGGVVGGIIGGADPAMPGFGWGKAILEWAARRFGDRAADEIEAAAMGVADLATRAALGVIGVGLVLAGAVVLVDAGSRALTGEPISAHATRVAAARAAGGGGAA